MSSTFLLTDSSARQLCSCQGTGKVKHLSAKIQDQVRNDNLGHQSDCLETLGLGWVVGAL